MSEDVIVVLGVVVLGVVVLGVVVLGVVVLGVVVLGVVVLGVVVLGVVVIVYYSFTPCIYVFKYKTHMYNTFRVLALRTMTTQRVMRDL